MKTMKTNAKSWLLAALLAFSFSQSGPSADPGNKSTFLLLEHRTRKGDKLQWRVDTDRINSQPRCDFKTQALPISPGEAVAIAEKHTREVSADPKLTEIRLRPTDPYAEKLDNWFYIVEFETRAFEQSPVVILMDRTIVEPLRGR